MACTRAFARASAGTKIAARMPMLAITTSSSIRVKALLLAPWASPGILETGKLIMTPIRCNQPVNI